ncbi:SIMPL domain-containing protein [Aliagarivorans taiwanensis]|uniref:SIMPL domain-containing protein n=1 Tax=Aliagarivorans taiwanensis TaxID=561966 RepID=UPI0003FA0D5E|nr:SIMPL domain-containing protein [Aliagarivorans taiwanensis]
MKQLLLSLSVLLSSPLFAASLHTSGEARLAVEADRVKIEYVVSELSDSAGAALSEVEHRVKLLLEDIKPLVTDSDRIEASQVQLYQDSRYQDKSRQFIGYRAQRSVIVELDDLSRMAAVLDIVKKGLVSEIRPLRYSSSKSVEYQQQVRSMAIDDSYQKALQLANGYQSRLGDVQEIRYRSAGPVPVMRMEALAASDAPVYQGAQIIFSDKVDVTFELISN